MPSSSKPERYAPNKNPAACRGVFVCVLRYRCRGTDAGRGFSVFVAGRGSQHHLLALAMDKTGGGFGMGFGHARAALAAVRRTATRGAAMGRSRFVRFGRA